MTLEERVYTAADLEALYELPENADKKFELHRGVIYQVPTGTPLHAWVISLLFHMLSNHVLPRQLGFVFADSVDYYLPNGDVFIPDVSYVSYARQPELPDKFIIAPDLAVEVVSPSNRQREMLNKVESYLESGTKQVWLVYPDEKVIDVYRRAGDGTLVLKKYTVRDTLDAGDALPGFTLAVGEAFPK